MDARVINPFITVCFSILETILGEVPQRGTPAAQAADCTCHQVNVMVGFTGALTGNVIYGMPLTTADKIASIMIGTPVRTFDSMAASAIAELANMISGNVLMELSSIGLECDMTPPTIVRGRNVKMSTLDIPAIAIPFTTNVGELTVVVGVHPMIK